MGEQVPYLGSPILIPGVIEAGFYDAFEGVTVKIFLMLILQLVIMEILELMKT